MECETLGGSPFDLGKIKMLAVGIFAQVDEVAQNVRRQQHVIGGNVNLLRRAALLLEDDRVRAVVVGLARVPARRS